MRRPLVLCLAMLVWLTGCASTYTDYRERGPGPCDDPFYLELKSRSVDDLTPDGTT